MPFVVLLLVALAAGLLAAFAASLGPARSAALALATGSCVVLALLTALVSTTSIGFDRTVASWAHRRSSSWSTHALDAVTHLGSITVVVALALVLAAYGTVRLRTPWVAAFLVAAVGGEELLTTVLKDLVDRRRPAFVPAAATLGPAFPSGHSAHAAVFYASAALVLACGRARAVAPPLAGAAAGVAAGVAASRVFLDLHWMTDVIGGLALGWGWFAVCGLALGGRMLRPGARPYELR